MKHLYDSLRTYAKEEEAQAVFCKFFKMRIFALRGIDHYAERAAKGDRIGETIPMRIKIEPDSFQFALRASTMLKRTILAIAVLCLIGIAWSAWDQAQLERGLCHGFSPLDYYPEGDPPDVPLRNRNAISEFQCFLDNSGWTTNQLIEGLMVAATNNMAPANWSNEDCRNIAGVAMWKLSEINHPSVTNFFRWYNDVDETRRYKLTAVTAMFRYTNLEPSVMGYLRTLCVRTNIYDRAAGEILYPLFETLDTMPDDFKPAATNRVAQYLYFASHHVTDSQGEHDFELCRFLPVYSNSVQRLELMRYVAASATNAWERANASNVVYVLSSIPTNQLNDVSWITEE